MKKFVLFFAMIIAFVCANAQPLKQDKFLDETFIGITVGAEGQAKTGEWLGMNAGLRLGKWFTPQVGVELEGSAQFNDFYKSIYNHRIGVNALLNLDYLTGYKGFRQDVEVVPFVGLGWQRNYCTPYYYDGIGTAGGVEYTHSNDLYTKMGIQVNVNFRHGWQFNIIPQVAYNLTAPGKMQYNVNYLDYGLALGVTYNFKNSHGTHWFDVCDKQYTQADMNIMNDRINCLLEDIKGLEKENIALQKNLEDCMNTPVEVTAVVEATAVYILPNVQFLFNSAQISDTSISTLYEIAELIIANPETKWALTGYASNEGSEAYNLNLSRDRATSVYNHLVKYGVNPNQLTVVAGGITEEYPEPCLNRIVTVTQQ